MISIRTATAYPSENMYIGRRCFRLEYEWHTYLEGDNLTGVNTEDCYSLSVILLSAPGDDTIALYIIRLSAVYTCQL